MGLGPGLGQLVFPGNLNLAWNDIIWVSGLSKLGYLDFPCQSFYLLSHQYPSNKVHSCLSDPESVSATYNRIQRTVTDTGDSEQNMVTGLSLWL